MTTGYGRLDITWVYQSDHPVCRMQIRIDHADPVVRISEILLETIRKLTASGKDWPVSLDGDVLRIYGINRTVIYRIVPGRVPVPGTTQMWYRVGEWPD